MRLLVSIAVVALLLASSVAAFQTVAQEQLLHDLLPTVADVGSDFVVIDDRPRSLEEQATGFSDAGEAASLLAEWGWQENAFLVFQSAEPTANGEPAATIDISLTRFADVESAAAAMPYFLEDRAAVLGQHEVPLSDNNLIGDEARGLSGADDLTIFVRSGPLLMRISATAVAGSSATSAEQLARSIVDRAAGLQQPAISADRAIDAYLSETLPLREPSCPQMSSEEQVDIPALIERFDGIPDAAATLENMGWQEGASRQFACDNPPAGGVGWVNMSVLRFADAAAAADAVTLFANARAGVTNLRQEEALALGESAAALAGPAVNGTEYTLFLSNGPLLFRVTGVAPEGDPRQDVEAIAMALYEQSLATPEGPLPTPTPQTHVLIQPTATVVPIATTSPLPTPSPAPTIAPLATATPVPMPTFTPVPTTVPVMIPTAVPTAIPTAIPTAVPTTIPVIIPTAPPPAPTATSGPLPTPTPRVIRPPTPASE